MAWRQRRAAPALVLSSDLGKGWVFALDLALVTAAAPIGLAVAGPLADAVGVRSWFVTGGLVTTVMGAGAFFIPAIMRIEDGVLRVPQEIEKIASGD